MTNSSNCLYHGDCLEVLKNLPSESVDLIYLDPPFFSNRNYEVIWGDEGEVRSFRDRWAGGMDHYIGWLKERVEEMHRLLKPTGSIYLHCDWHADAYIRVNILDKLFGYKNFRGAITWKRTFAHNDARKKVAVLSDTIFYYSKSQNCTFHGYWGALSQKYIADFYKYQDDKGVYQPIIMTGPGVNPNDKEWMGYHPEKVGRHWALSKEIIISLVGEEKQKEMDCIQKLNLLYENGHIEIKEGNAPRFKRYLKEDAKQILGDFWTDLSSLDTLSNIELVNEIFNALTGNMWHDINNVQGSSAERIGYPTQKPEALLERIIKASSKEGDVVLDPFLGGGTTSAVAQRLGRGFIGIDASPIAVAVSEARLEKTATLFTPPFSVITQKYDYNQIRNSDAFAFEAFIVEKFGGAPNTKQRGDMGMDGIKDKKPIQVKRSDNIGRNVVDNFKSAAQRFDAKKFEDAQKAKEPAGWIIAFSFGKGAVEEAARLKNEEGIIIELVRVEDIIALSTNPKVDITIASQNKGASAWEIAFEAKSDQKIVQYQWDFNYKAEDGFKPAVLYTDKGGEQSAHTFKAGTYTIACRVTNEDGIHGLESIKITVNGKVSQN